MKIGRFEEAYEYNEFVMKTQAELKTEFGEDYAIVASKFYMQQANINFIGGDLEKAKEAAERGIELVAEVKTDDEDIRKASNHTQRDLLNLLVRARSRLENRDAREIRSEMSAKHGLGPTFMTMHDKQQQRLDEVHE